MPRKGETMSIEEREKRRVALLGRPRPEEVKRKISASHFGIKHTEAAKKKISEAQKGKPRTESQQQAIEDLAEFNRGKKRPPYSAEWRHNLGTAHRGTRLSVEHKAKIADALKGNQHTLGKAPWNKGKTGLGGYTWKKGAKTPENLRFRLSVAYKEWRTAVFERDSYTCQGCGKRGGRLNADHIKPFADHPELRLDIDNGRTLCEPCHRQTDTYGLKLVHGRRKQLATKSS
jgi:hypothetical protein